MIYRLILSYRGTAYAGWQRQDNALAVQQVVEEALSKLLARPLHVVGASRTDAGVHARGQAVHLSLEDPFPERGLIHGTNRLLPKDIRVMASDRMPEGFHARRSASGKEYAYRLTRASFLSPLDSLFSVAVDPRIEIDRLREAATQLPGRHDFTAFAASGGAHTHPYRTLSRAVWEEDGAALVFRVEGDGFLRGMVRALVGTLLEVGRGRRSPEDFAKLLEGAPRAASGPTAPPQGLVLERVVYAREWTPLGIVGGGLES